MKKILKWNSGTEPQVKEFFESNDEPTRLSPPPGSETRLWIKSKGWVNLGGFLDTLEQMPYIGGLRPIKELAEGFAERINIFEDAGQGQKEYDELRKELDQIFRELRQYCSSLSIITASMESICGFIQRGMEDLQPVELTIGRLVGNDKVLERYKEIRDHLQRLSRNADMSIWKVVDEVSMDTCIKKLAPSLWPCYNSEKATALGRRGCTEGTRTDVLAQMHRWVDARNSGNPYWMNGMDGVGKTTICYSFCQQLDARKDRLLCASFFCSRLLPECRDVARVIPLIAYQLAQSSRPFRYALSQVMEKDPDAHARSPHLQFDTLIMKPLSNQQVRKALPANMVVVIDGLDECEDARSTEQILDVLLTGSKNLPIHFIVSSRPEVAIRDQMEKGKSYYSLPVLHELNSQESKKDIKTYLQAELAPVSPSDSDLDKLAESAGPSFIHAATVVRYVGHGDFRRNPQRRLQVILGISGRRSWMVDRLYETILGEAMNDDGLEQTDREDMKLVLEVVSFSKTPLTVDAINRLLSFGDTNRVRMALRPFWSVLHVMEPIMTITPLHNSFPKYLADASRSGSEWHHGPFVDHNYTLAQRCFEDIRDTNPQFNICRLPTSFLYDHDVIDARAKEFISTELRYACKNWSLHLAASDPVGASTLMELLDQFLKKNLLLWMEVMILTKKISASMEILSLAKQWAMRHGATRELEDLIHGAWLFVISVISSPVSQHTPHIYSSILPFLPSYSPVRKHYVYRVQGFPGVSGTALNREKARLARWKVRYGWCAACSADGTLLAIGPSTNAQYISLISTFTGRLVRDIPLEDPANVWCIAFSPDGTRVACGTNNDMIWVWDVQSGQSLLGPLEGHQESVISIIFSRDGSRIVSGSYDGTARIWDAQSGQCLFAEVAGQANPVRCLAISSDGGMFISASYDKIICVWPRGMHGWGPVFTQVIAQNNNTTSIALYPDDSRIVSGSDDCTVRVWDTRTGKMVLGPLKHEGKEPTTVAVSPDGASILAGFVDGTIQIWDATTGRPISNRLKAHSGDLDVLTYSTDGNLIVSYSPVDQKLCIFDAQSATAVLDALPGHTMPILFIDISPDGKRIVSSSEDTTLCIWDPIMGQLIHGPLTGHTSTVNLVRYSLDGTRILSCSSDRTLRQWNAQTGATRETKTPIVDTFVPLQDRWQKAGFVSATYSPDGNSIATISRGGDIQTWDSSNGEMILGPIKTEMEGVSIEFSADGETLITGWANGAVRIWDVQSRQLLSSHQPQDAVHPLVLAFSPDGLHYITASRNSRDNPTLHQRSIETGAHIPGSFTGHTSFVSTARYSSDGTHIVSGSYDKTVHIWDAQTGTSVFGPLRGHTAHVRSVAYSPDGTYVASASDDMTIRIWDARKNDDSRVHGVPKFNEWVLNEDGWVVDDQSRRLIWVPPDLRASVMSPRNTALLSRDGYVQLDFEGSRIGEGWDSS